MSCRRVIESVQLKWSPFRYYHIPFAALNVFLFTFFFHFTQERLCQEPRLRRNVYTLSLRPRRAVPSMLRQESRVKLRRDSNISSICKVTSTFQGLVTSPSSGMMMICRATPTWTMTRPARPPARVSEDDRARATLSS